MSDPSQSSDATAPRLLLTEAEAGKALNCSPRTIHELRKAGKLKATVLAAKCVRYSVDELRRFIAAATEGADHAARD